MFLECIEIVHKTLKNEPKPDLIDFVFNIKLNSNAITLLTTEQYPSTFDNLKSIIQKHSKSPSSMATIYATLSAPIQKGSITGFRDKTIFLVSELNCLQIWQPNTNDTATTTKFNERRAVQIFKNDLNDKYKQTISAAQAQIFSRATSIALKLEEMLS